MPNRFILPAPGATRDTELMILPGHMQCWDMKGRPKPPCGNHALQPRFEVLELLVDGGALFGSLLLAIGLLLGAQLLASLFGQLLLLLFGRRRSRRHPSG
mgnify:CR=1 FL=1